MIGLGDLAIGRYDRLGVSLLLPSHVASARVIYDSCIRAAEASDCSKMKFGAVLVPSHPHSSGLGCLASCNRRMPPLAYLCEETCIRMTMQSRTDGLIGACAHAEEQVLWAAKSLGYDLRDAALYVGGFDPRSLGKAWRSTRRWTCLRCAIAMWHSGIAKVMVPVTAPDTHNGWQWEGILIPDAMRDAVDFAMGKATGE